MRIIHDSVQGNHLHLIVEAEDQAALSRGMQGLAIRLARRLNALARRHGPVFVDRYHSHPLKTPREVRNALVYVLANFRKHSQKTRAPGVDPFSSGAWFEGWRRWKPGSGVAPPFAEPAGWLHSRATAEPSAVPINAART